MMGRYTFHDGAFYSPDGQQVQLADIPENKNVCFPGETGQVDQYIGVMRLLDPSIYNELLARCLPEDEALIQHWEAERAFVTEVLGGLR